MAWVYILECSDATLYVGSTTSLRHRLHQHLRGEGAIYTRRRRPLRLIWCAEFDRIDEAFAFEKRIQGWSRAKKLALIDNDGDAIRRLSLEGVKPSRVHVRTDHLESLTPW